MELWELISLLCKRVVDDQNVYLDILITQNGWEIMLMPMDKEEDEDD